MVSCKGIVCRVVDLMFNKEYRLEGYKIIENRD